MVDTFLGYRRVQGRAGVRNKVLVLPIDRYTNQIAWQIQQVVSDVTVFPCPGDMGRHGADRERLFRLTRGLACHPNVHSVLLVGVKPDFNYPEMRANRLLEAIRATGRRVEVVMVNEAGGMGLAALQGQTLARQLVREASAQAREPVPLGDLAVGIKCGVSDGTSGISGNPALGAAMDILIAAGGAALFSETTEIIGAEALLAERAVNPDVAQRVLEMAARTENRAKAVGEDIRSINPIPSNIKAGISTLEEKSLGAIAKGGTTPLVAAIEHAEPLTGPGLHFMDGWMATNSLLPALAATGCQIVVLQGGGGDLPSDPPIPAVNASVVSPLFFMTGNPHLAAKASTGVDFDSSGVLTGAVTLSDSGRQLIRQLAATASGAFTWGETLKYQEPLEPWFDGPFF